MGDVFFSVWRARVRQHCQGFPELLHVTDVVLTESGTSRDGETGALRGGGVSQRFHNFWCGCVTDSPCFYRFTPVTAATPTFHTYISQAKCEKL